MPAPPTTYPDRTEHFRRQSLAGRARYNRLALVRLGLFLSAILPGIYLGSVHWAAAAVFVLLFVAGFYRFVRWHQGILREAEHLERMARINAHEAEVLERLFPAGGLWPDGAGFIDPHHAYTLDLDVFGPYSYFHYVNRAGTAIGRERLADYLRHAAGREEMAARQDAIGELSGRLDWRQHFQAYGLQVRDDLAHLDLLRQWLGEAPFVLPNRWLRAARYLVPLWMTAGLLLWVLYLPWQVVLLFVALPGWILLRTREQVDRTHHRTARAEEILLHYARLIRHIEGAGFAGSRLRALHATLHPGGRPASAHVQELSYIISQLNVRYNAFAVFLNLFGLWDLHWVARLERWKDRHRADLPAWFDALAELEAISSLATALYNNPDWTFPQITGEPVFRSEGLGHPLIHPRERVRNDLHMPTHGHIKLITGSNMAGKSTFLRTAGLNIVLAMAGAPVCARRLSLPPLEVYTSMRTQDALHESTSSFYAELKRLKFIIEAVEEGRSGRQVFFLLDEILKGTNSRDRHTGSRALIRQLIRQGGAGLIATHDLELGVLENQYGGALENLCMEVAIQNGNLHFDYKLKKGVSQSFNATLLMRNMGIRIEEE